MVYYITYFFKIALKISPALFMVSSCWPASQMQRIASMKLTSPSFIHGASIPSKYTCEGNDISPELMWTAVPKNTKSFALICDDPDAPGGTWVHWVIFNIPPTITKIPEGGKPAGIQGTNSWEKTGYGGPCPPSGTHRYFFTLYAVDTELSLDQRATANDVKRAIEGHKLATAQLLGVYEKKKR